ncbi:PepSY domain-containing protein [Feifania hominis]|uniref:PepSY domain-containing protein n=1 Tax=Feifania hominis TaxID=2763660 RepID=A0A926DFS3_9FIRM|nr:PepSY domain-containing protein [Feifania hominis]MBC8536489.1 PepSY domain-containing protein [Feifania hominis]
MKTGIRRATGRRLTALLLCTVLLAGVLALSAGAANTTVTAQLSPHFTIEIDGAEKTFYDAGGNEAHPIVYNGTTYLPLRAIGELMGKNVNWDEANLTVTLAGSRITAAVSGTPDTAAKKQNISAQIRRDFTIVVDGVTRTFADGAGNRVYPLLYNGITYLPLRSVGELMGDSVSFDSKTSTVILKRDSLVTDADSFNQGSQGSQTTTPSTDGVISAETAKAKALAHAGLKAADVTFVKSKLEWDDGRRVYDVEFYTADYREYDYEIDAVTGSVLSFDYDADSYTPPSTGERISEAKARSIALAKVPGATASHVKKLKLDRDDGRWEYEIEIVYKEIEYDFEIDAVTGAILSWDAESIYD